MTQTDNFQKEHFFSEIDSSETIVDYVDEHQFQKVNDCPVNQPNFNKDVVAINQGLFIYGELN